jgi:hypothetical protein
MNLFIFSLTDDISAVAQIGHYHLRFLRWRGWSGNPLPQKQLGGLCGSTFLKSLSYGVSKYLNASFVIGRRRAIL